MGTSVEDIIASVLARNPRDKQGSALCARGELLALTGQIDEALACFDAALRMDAQLARGWVGRGAILLRQGRASEALGCVSRALDAEPSFPPALVLKGDMLRKRGVREEALACYEDALAANPSLADAWFARANVLYELRRITEARRAIERFLGIAAEDHPELLTAQMMLRELERAGAKPSAPPASIPPAPESKRRSDRSTGAASKKSDRNGGAAKKSDRSAGKKSDRSAGKKSVRTEKKSLRGEPKASKKSARGMSASASTPATSASATSTAAPPATSASARPAPSAPPDVHFTSRPAHGEERVVLRPTPAPKATTTPVPPKRISITNVAGSKGDLTEADIATFDEVRALCLANRQLEALRKVEPIVKRCTESGEAWLLRGHILLALHQTEPALQSVEKALRIEPRDLEAAKLLVKVLTVAKKDERALAAADRVLELAPRDPEAHRVRADCLVVLMRQNEAVFAYEKVIHYLPDDAAAWVALGRTLRQLRRFAEARMTLTKGLSLAEGSSPEIAAQAREFLAKLPPG